MAPAVPHTAPLLPRELSEKPLLLDAIDEKHPLADAPLDEKTALAAEEAPTPESPTLTTPPPPHSAPHDASLPALEPAKLSEPRPVSDAPQDVPAPATDAPPAPAPDSPALSTPPPQLTLDAPASDGPDGRRYSHPEFIEKLFQSAEDASERRAAEEEARARKAEEPTHARRASANLSIRVGTPLGGDARGRRRGGSVSVSRFGAPPEASTPEGSAPATPSRLSAVILQNPLYQQQLAARGSRDTVSSTDSVRPAHADDPADTVTQITTIPGRSRSATLSKAVGAALARRLSRAPSKDMLAPVAVGADGASAVVIGVSVQSATVTVVPEADADAEGASGAPGGASAVATAAAATAEEAGRDADRTPSPGATAIAVITATATAAAVGTHTDAELKRRELKREGSRGMLGGKDWFKSLTSRFKRKSSRESVVQS